MTKLELWGNLVEFGNLVGNASAALVSVTAHTVPPAQRQAEVRGTLLHAQLLAGSMHAQLPGAVASSFPSLRDPITGSPNGFPTKPAVACGVVEILSVYLHYAFFG